MFFCIGADRLIQRKHLFIQQETEEEEHETFDYKETASATTGLGDLLKGLKL